jgi:hypothetical protein
MSEIIVALDPLIKHNHLPDLIDLAATMGRRDQDWRFGATEKGIFFAFNRAIDAKVFEHHLQHQRDELRRHKQINRMSMDSI